MLGPASRALAVVLVTLLGTAACSADDGPSSDESFATETADRELARIGGGGAFSVVDDSAYFVFDNGLHQVDASGQRKKLGPAPDLAGELVVTPRRIVLEANPLSGSTLTFYDRFGVHSPNEDLRIKVLPIATRIVDMIAIPGDRVVASFLGGRVVVYSADGEELASIETEAGEARSLQRGGRPDVLYATVSRGERKVIEIDVAARKTRDVFSIPEGSFVWTYDAATDGFFTVRTHVSLPEQSIVERLDGKGAVLAKLATPLNVASGMPVADGSAFYLAARPGRSPGVGSWKLFAFDKQTLAMTDRGRVEPQVGEMVLAGDAVWYAHHDGAAHPLRRRAVSPRP